ncbi:hypothetical protein BC628DRAFT_1127726 [Trametes gibbosa]|nr:hypothetical protein BC628DRAFT_1127726 [Trametes gibbosa]
MPVRVVTACDGGWDDETPGVLGVGVELCQLAWDVIGGLGGERLCAEPGTLLAGRRWVFLFALWSICARETEDVGYLSSHRWRVAEDGDGLNESGAVTMGISNLPVSPTQKCGMGHGRISSSPVKVCPRPSPSPLPPPPLPLSPSFFGAQVTSGCPVAPLDHFHSFRHSPIRPPAGFQLRQ